MGPEIKMTQISSSQWGYYINGLMRWYKRLVAVYKPRRSLDYDYADDVTNAFFLFCYHLKDWLINDSSIKIAAKDVETFISASTPLSISADLANGSKHLGLTRVRSNAKNLKVNPTIKMTLVVNSKSKSKAYYSRSIEVDGKVYDALDLAKLCLVDWQTYLKSKGLIKNDLV